jgi:hypothetical protein
MPNRESKSQNTNLASLEDLWHLKIRARRDLEVGSSGYIMEDLSWG